VNRREFITLIGGTTAWPLMARAQQPAMPVIGFLNGQSLANFMHLLAAFRSGLSETGYEEGRNTAIEFRWAEGRADRLPALANELVRSQVAVLVATGGAHLAAKEATATIPIVCTMGDPLKLGLVGSLSRPGGNLTGVSILTNELEPKRLELLQELVPQPAPFAVLLDPDFPEAAGQARELQAAAGTIGRQIHIVSASTELEIEKAFIAVVGLGAAGLVVTANPFFNSRRDQIIALAARHVLPAIYESREAPASGGLMSYGPNLPAMYRQVGIYAGRILKGERPGDLPVQQPTKFDMVINLRAAKALGLTPATSVLLRADEVIE
jgi:putative ABC transport system substrate-binding protein